MEIDATYQKLLLPTQNLIKDLTKIDGDLMILGAGGKMGPALALLAKQAIDISRIDKKVYAVARFSEPGVAESLRLNGIETIKADLLNEADLSSLPEVKNVLYLAGTKFGTTGNEPYTWAMNAYLPGRVAQKFKDSNIVVFSTGNVYPFTPIVSGGATEDTKPGPLGEYGQSCLGRERIFEYFSAINHTPILIYRLNYAIDVSYGVLLEIAKSVKEGKTIDLSMGHVNVIWQGDANEIALRALLHCGVPEKLLNVTGAETYSVRWLAEEFGKRLETDPKFSGEEKSTALLSNASECTRIFGLPPTSITQMLDITSQWLLKGGKVINKPTHFSERTGNY